MTAPFISEHSQLTTYQIMTINQLMRTVMLASVLTGVCSATAMMAGHQYSRMSANREKSQQVPELSATYDGMSFDVRGVVETFGYNESVWYMVYDDPDAGMDYEAIRIDKRTHDRIVEVQKNGFLLTGELKAVQSYESVEYVLVSEEVMVCSQYQRVTL